MAENAAITSRHSLYVNARLNSLSRRERFWQSNNVCKHKNTENVISITSSA